MIMDILYNLLILGGFVVAISYFHQLLLRWPR